MSCIIKTVIAILVVLLVIGIIGVIVYFVLPHGEDGCPPGTTSCCDNTAADKKKCGVDADGLALGDGHGIGVCASHAAAKAQNPDHKPSAQFKKLCTPKIDALQDAWCTKACAGKFD